MAMIVNTAIIIFAVALTLVLLKKGINLGIIMLIDTVFIVILEKVPVKDAFRFAFYGLISSKTIELILVLFLIMILENIMRTTGMIKTMVDCLKELVGNNRVAAGLMPAVIGLLPSPGGARFSCPMVGEVVGENTDSENKAFINYWFRHIWMDGFILYPGVIVASGLIGVSVIDFFVHLLPFMMFTVLLGVIFGLRYVKKEQILRTRPISESLKGFFVSMLPVIIVIAVYMGLLRFTDYSLEIASGLMGISLFIVKKYNAKRVLTTLKEAFPLKLVLIIIGVMIFKEVLLDSGAMDGLPELMKAHGIPVTILFFILPFLGAFASGITVSFVSLAFPILIPLGLGSNLWFAAAAYAAGVIGNMITPLHLCAVMTADYFKTGLGKLLVKTTIAEIAMFIIVCMMLWGVKL